MRAFLALPLLAASCAASAPRAAGPPAPPDEATSVLSRFADALESGDSAGIAATIDPGEGAYLWSQPGVAAMPIVHLPDGHPIHGELVLPDDYRHEVAGLIRLGVRIHTVDGPAYRVPPEEEIARAPAWATLRTRGVVLDAARYPVLEEVTGVAAAIRRSPPVLELDVEHGYSSLQVFLTRTGGRLRISHVILTSWYDA